MVPISIQRVRAKAQVWKTGAGIVGHEFGRPFAYFEFRTNQAGEIGGCQAEARD